MYKRQVPDFVQKITFNNLSEEIEANLTVGSYQEGLLNQYFNENPGIKDILQKKFRALYEKACEIIEEMCIRDRNITWLIK